MIPMKNIGVTKTTYHHIDESIMSNPFDVQIINILQVLENHHKNWSVDRIRKNDLLKNIESNVARSVWT